MQPSSSTRRSGKLHELAAAAGLSTDEERAQHEANVQLIKRDLLKRFEITPQAAQQAAAAAYRTLLQEIERNG